MNNKWLKWVIGVGGISSFTLFLQTIDANNEAGSRNEDYRVQETSNTLQQQGKLSINIEEREQQLMALDWDEGNWDVEYSNEAIIATPKLEMPYLDRAEQRTRRS